MVEDAVGALGLTYMDKKKQGRGGVRQRESHHNDTSKARHANKSWPANSFVITIHNPHLLTYILRVYALNNCCHDMWLSSSAVHDLTLNLAANIRYTDSGCATEKRTGRLQACC